MWIVPIVSDVTFVPSHWDDHPDIVPGCPKRFEEHLVEGSPRWGYG
jgi:hypothetical protein